MYDVTIIGAGPAGSSAAYELAKKGLKTLLLEKKKIIGQPKQCAEGINQAILKELNIKLKPEWISNKINSVIVSNCDYFLYGRGKRTQGYILNRKKFDPGLAQKAQNAGAELRKKSPVINVTGDSVILKNKQQIKTKVIIGADGPLSTVGKKSGLGNPVSGSALQYEIEKQTPFPNSIQCFFSRQVTPNGWSWIFPKKNTMNVGIGTFNISNLRKNLNHFVKYMKLEKLKIKEINAALIPLNGPLKQFQKDNILLIGDAAGHTNPLSGGGIPVAIYDGQLAANVITEHLEKNTLLASYTSRWYQSCFGRASKNGLKAQKIYLKLLQKGKLDQFLNKTKNQKITTVKKAWSLLKYVPLTSFFSFYRFGKIGLRNFRYAW